MSLIWRQKTFFSLLVLASLLSLGALAQSSLPALTGHVIDQTHTLDPQQVNRLEEKLAALESSSGAQIILLLVPSTQPEDIASYANRVANQWKVGRKEIGDGVVVVVAIQDRKARIEVAKTLEGAIPDLMARRIIDSAMTPRFRQGDFAGGLDASVDQLATLIRGEGLPSPSSTSGSVEGEFDWRDFAIFLFAGVPIVATVARDILGKRLGSLATGLGAGFITWSVTASLLIAAGAGLFALLFVLLSNNTVNSGQWRQGPHGGRHGGSGGWGSTGGGGGGFSSGGGGDFGGGGASGGW